LPAKEAQIAKLQKKSEDSALWDNPSEAAQVMKRLADLRDDVDTWKSINQRLQDALELAGMEDETLRADLESEADALQVEVDKRELKALLAGPYDRNDCLLAIHAGAGGTDSQDWAEMLLRMYLRWAERSGYKTEILDTSPGEEAGIKSVTVSVDGPFAMATCTPRRVCTAWCASRPSIRPPPAHVFCPGGGATAGGGCGRDRDFPKDIRIDTYRSAGAAVRTCRRMTRLCASRTSRPGSW